MDVLQSAVALTAQLIDLAVQVSNDLHSLVDRSAELGSFALPPTDTINLCGSSAHLCVNPFAQLALVTGGKRLHDKLHATRFAHSVLLGTVLSEVSPLPVATSKAMLVKEAHVSRFASLRIRTLY